MIANNDFPINKHVFDMLPKIKFSWIHRSRKKNRGRHFPRYILDTIGKKLSWYKDPTKSSRITSIIGCTEIHLAKRTSKDKTRNIIRAHPDYRGHGIWMDWVDVSWECHNNQEDIVLLPAQVLMILNFDHAEYEELPRAIVETLYPFFGAVTDSEINDPQMSTYLRKGIHLLVHSAEDDGTNTPHYYEDMEEEKAIQLVSICNRSVMEPHYQLVYLNNISGIAYVARDPLDIHGNNDESLQYEITYVNNPDDWCDAFITKHHRGFKRPQKHEASLDAFNEDFNPW